MTSSRLLTVLLLAAWGCGRTSATPPVPAPASRGSGAYGGVAGGAPAASIALSSPVALDPSEAITPRELASIPDPVPGEGPMGPGHGVSERVAAVDSAITPERSAAVSSADTRADPPRGAATGDVRGGIWRVQVFASPDLAQADRIAKEASLRFGVPSVIEFEDTLYKVRLGAFATEALAQSLRERAIQGGFPGAFRMWSVESATTSSK